mmetsp:Transcript_17985/g.20793  ORF Transcript_17985/g.20793 Transcript_17985/m.20793 type:complete len:405 (+) Transcript_17985:130-1344(+)
MSKRSSISHENDDDKDEDDIIEVFKKRKSHHDKVSGAIAGVTRNKDKATHAIVDLTASNVDESNDDDDVFEVTRKKGDDPVTKYSRKSNGNRATVIPKKNNKSHQNNGKTNTGSSNTQENQSFKVFCDLDGVLVDFERGVLELFRKRKQHYKSINEIHKGRLWATISSDQRFFRSLNWTKDGQLLWNYLVDAAFQNAEGENSNNTSSHSSSTIMKNGSSVQQLSILTGCPMQKEAKSQKFTWCERHLNIERMNIYLASSSSTSSQIKNNGKLKNESNKQQHHCNRHFVFQHVDKAAKKSMHEIVNGNTSNARTITSMFQKKKQPNTMPSTSSLSQQKHAQSKTIQVITCWSKNKHYESKKNHILIDDRISLKQKWVEKGGIFIHHVNSEQSIQELKKLGIGGRN